MLKVHRLQGPVCDANAYVIIQEQASQAIIIDPGNEDIRPIEAVLADKTVHVPYVILTHEHHDHIAGADSVRLRYGSKLICSEVCGAFIGNPKKNLSRYSTQHDISAGPPDYLSEELGSTLCWLKTKIRLINTPGHSPSSICVAIGDCLFTGDTILGDGPTPCNLPGGDRNALRKSVALLLEEFGPDIRVFPGHGRPFPFSRLNYDTVVEKRPICQRKRI